MRLKYFLRGLGLGVIVTTLILSISHASSSKPMSDADVIDRAKELGMVYGSLFDENFGSDKETEATDNTTEGITENTDNVTDPNSTETTDNAGEGITDNAESSEADDKNVSSEEQSSTEAETEPSAEAETTSPQVTEQSTENTTQSSETTKATEGSTQSTDVATEPSIEVSGVVTDENGVITYQLRVEPGMTSRIVASAIEKAGIVSNAEELDKYLIGIGYDDIILVGTFTLNSTMSYEEIASVITGK